MKLLVLVTLIGVSATALGCGGGGATYDGSPAGGSCPSTFTPCGGNPTGTWRLRTDCTSTSSSSNSSCPGQSTSTVPGSGYSATYTFNANGTLNILVSGSLTEVIRYPPECLYSDASATQACADRNKTMQSVVAMFGDAGSTTIKSLSISCAADSSGFCVCSETFNYGTYTITGSYTTSGTKLAVTALSTPGMPDGGAGDAGTSAPVDYCVSGNNLWIGPSSSSSSSSVITLTK